MEKSNDDLYLFKFGLYLYAENGRYYAHKPSSSDLIEEVFITTKKPVEQSAEPLAKDATLHDFYVGQAIVGHFSVVNFGDFSDEDLVKYSRDIADEAMKQRAEREVK
jgi:hypothetical protein